MEYTLAQIKLQQVLKPFWFNTRDDVAILFGSGEITACHRKVAAPGLQLIGVITVHQLNVGLTAQIWTHLTNNALELYENWERGKL